MYKMSSGSEKLTQERTITLEKYSENKIHTIWVNKKGANELYVIWLKMSDLHKKFRSSKFISFTNKNK